MEKVGLATNIAPSPPKQVAINRDLINSSEPLPTEILSAVKVEFARFVDSLTYWEMAFFKVSWPPSG
jgi:hypothetical protein